MLYIPFGLHPYLKCWLERLKFFMSMTDAEQFSLLGEGNPKLSKGALIFSDGSHADMGKEGYAEPNGSDDIRNWLKGIRDSGYVCMHLGSL